MSTPVSPLATLGAISRRTTTLALLLTMVAAALVGPSVVAPRLTDSASAAVYSSCTVSRCADARAARSGWSAKGFPTSRGWYSWSGGKSNFMRRPVLQLRGSTADQRHLLRVRRLPAYPGRRPGRVPDRGEPQHRGHLVLTQPLHRLLPALTDRGPAGCVRPAPGIVAQARPGET